MLNLMFAFGYSSLGYILYNSGDYQGAIENYTQAILQNSEDLTSYLSRGVARSLTKDYQNAIEDFNETIRLSPQYAQAYAERGVARAAIGDNQSAIEDCHRAIQLDPQYVRAYFGRGAACFYSGNYQGALENFSLIASMERSAISYYNLGILQYSQGINSQAIKHLTKALYVDPNLIAAYYVRGNACYELGDEQGAFADFNEAKHIEAVGGGEIYSEDEFAFYARGLACHRLGNREEAIADLQESAQIALKHQNTIFHQKAIDFMSEIQSEAMFGLSELKQTRVYQEAEEEGKQKGRFEAKLEAVPKLLALGLSVEQISQALDLDVAQVQQAVQQTPLNE